MSDDQLSTIFIIVWVGLVILCTMFFVGRDASFKKRWHVRISLICIAVIGGFMVFIVAKSVGALAVLPVVVGIVAIGYLSVTKVRVCDSCGKTNQPQNLITAPEYCSKCGKKLSPSEFIPV